MVPEKCDWGHMFSKIISVSLGVVIFQRDGHLGLTQVQCAAEVGLGQAQGICRGCGQEAVWGGEELIKKSHSLRASRGRGTQTLLLSSWLRGGHPQASGSGSGRFQPFWKWGGWVLCRGYRERPDPVARRGDRCGERQELSRVSVALSL